MQIFVVCPFIDPSEAAEFEQVAATKQVYEEMLAYFNAKYPELHLAMLHGKLTNKQKTSITEQLYRHEIDLLVTTPVIEVGLDVPSAGAIVIESSERFGLASLHQLRGRVGRASLRPYCLLFTSNAKKRERLEQFTRNQWPQIGWTGSTAARGRRPVWHEPERFWQFALC